MGLTICSIRHTIALGGGMTTIGQADFDILAGIGPIVNTLARLGARYALTGSLAAVAHGVGRARPTTIALDVLRLPLITPEDLILFKLERAAAIWPRRGVDWYDLQYLLKFRQDLDYTYLDAQSAALGWMRGLTTARAAAQTE